jgi:methylthioribose-1-phosphate isomerase
MSTHFSIPVELSYQGRPYIAAMGPFERSLERDFALAANKRAIAECSDVEKLREVAVNLMEGWSNMQEAVASLVKENLELRQAMSMKDWDLKAASELLEEASTVIQDELKQRSSQAKRRLWPFG